MNYLTHAVAFVAGGALAALVFALLLAGREARERAGRYIDVEREAES